MTSGIVDFFFCPIIFGDSLKGVWRLILGWVNLSCNVWGVLFGAMIKSVFGKRVLRFLDTFAF